MDYLATGPGNLAALVIGVLLIVWAVYSRQSQNESTGDSSEAKPESAAPQSAPADAAPSDTVSQERRSIQGEHELTFSVQRVSEPERLREENERKQARIDELETELEQARSSSDDTQQAEDRENQRFGGATVVRGTDERPLVGDDELWEKTYQHRSFWMGEFARKTAPGGETQALIRDRRFYDCHLYGPIIFGPLSADEIDKVFVDCEWLEDEDVVSWPLAESSQGYIGAVRLEECRFEGCRLSRVGLLRQEESPPVEHLRTERDANRTESEQAKAERDDQLRARCFDLSDQLLEFLDDMRQKHPQDYHNETMPRYEQRLVGNVTRIVQALKQRGWWHPVEAKRLENPSQWEDLRSLADYVRAIGLGQLY